MKIGIVGAGKVGSACALAAVEGGDGAVEVAVAHQLDQHIGVVVIGGHGDVESWNIESGIIEALA